MKFYVFLQIIPSQQHLIKLRNHIKGMKKMNKKNLKIAILSTLVTSSAYADNAVDISNVSQAATSLNFNTQFSSTLVGNTGFGTSTTINGENIYIGTTPMATNPHSSGNTVYIGSMGDRSDLYLNGERVATERQMMNIQQDIQQSQSNMTNMQSDLNNKVTQTAIDISMQDAGLSSVYSVDQNGKISNNGTSTIPNQSSNSKSLTVLNTANHNVHGFYVDQKVAVMSGGTQSTSFTLDDDGAILSNSDTGAPIQLHGVANGTANNDAVNFSQLTQVNTQVTNHINQVDTQVNSRIDQLDTKVDKNATRAFSGIAQIAAMQAIPAPIAGKNYSIGMGGGFYAGQQAMAFGGKANVGEHLNVSASVANGFGSNKDMAASVGAGFSW